MALPRRLGRIEAHLRRVHTGAEPDLVFVYVDEWRDGRHAALPPNAPIRREETVVRVNDRRDLPNEEDRKERRLR